MTEAAKAKAVSENEFSSEHKDSDETKLVWKAELEGTVGDKTWYRARASSIQDTLRSILDSTGNREPLTISELVGWERLAKKYIICIWYSIYFKGDKPVVE